VAVFWWFVDPRQVPNAQTRSEQALLGIAADPAFATNGYIYVWYASTVL